jgi:uncharacterized protein YndB with AHSA1/START domain
MADQSAPIEHSVWIDADPDKVFSYFTEPEKLLRWMGAAAVLEASPGGRYEVSFKEGWISSGQFVVVDRPRRIVYTVGWEGNAQFPPGSTRVEVDLTPKAGGTQLRLRHYGPPAKGLESDGWSMYLERLIAVTSGRVPPSDPFEQLSAD